MNPLCEVPAGWCRGEQLEKFDTPGRFCLRQNMTAFEAFERYVFEKAPITADTIAIIWFDSDAARADWLQWWYAVEVNAGE